MELKVSLCWFIKYLIPPMHMRILQKNSQENVYYEKYAWISNFFCTNK